jgi:predicted Fe-S protein YdhL (DUF1289 family)
MPSSFAPSSDPAPSDAQIASPCVRLCTLNEADVCVGCGRTLDDIRQWQAMSQHDKAACVARARERLPALRPDWSAPARERG